MSEIRINDDSKDYLDENFLVEDDYYCHIKDMIKCKSCDKIILNDPMRCNECYLPFCKNCSEKQNEEKHTCQNATYTINIAINSMLEKLVYLCNNCKREVKKKDIEDHLKKKSEKIQNPDKLIDCIYRKKSLIKLSQDEIKKLPQEKKINHISCKIIFLILLIIVILLGRSNVGKSSLINT